MTTILTKKKDTTGAPAPGDLTNAAGGAELAVNTYDKRLYTKDSGGNVVEVGTNPTILNIDNIQIDGNTISSTNSNGNINLTPNGTGSVVVSKLQVTGTFQLDGNVTVGDSSADTLTINSTITSNLIFTDNTYDIGASGATRPRNLYLAGNAVVGGNTTLGDASGDSVTINASTVSTPNGLTFSGGTTTFSNNQVISVTDNSNAALRITQLGTGNALLVEDSSNPDSTPFVIDASGTVLVGSTTSITNGVVATTPVLQEHGLTNNSSSIGLTNWSSTAARTPSINFNRSAGNAVGTRGALTTSGTGVGAISFTGDDGTSWLEAARIEALIDGTPGTNDMPCRLVFSTTADGASSPTERMRIDNAGQVGIGGTPTTGATLSVTKNIAGATAGYGVLSNGQIQSTVTSGGNMFMSFPTTQATSFTLTNLRHFYANQSTIGAGSAVTNQYGFHAESTLTGATNNFGFYGNIASGTGRYNFYAAGTAENYFAGNVGIGTSSPGNKLEVQTTGSTPTVSIYNGGNTAAITSYTAQAGLQFISYQSDVGSPYTKTSAIIANADGTVPSVMQFWTKTNGQASAAERMRIDSSGNVGIGTTPSIRLDVVGGSMGVFTNSAATASTASSYALWVGNSATRDITIGSDATYAYIQSWSGKNLYLNSQGNSILTAARIGSNTTTPTTWIDIAGSSSAAGLRTPNILEISTVSATAATGTINYDVTTQSVVYYTSNASGNFTLNFRGSSGTSLNTIMNTGDTVTVVFLCTNGSTAYYNSAVQVDGSSVTPKWQGGTAPTSGNASSVDAYTYAIVKTGNAAFTILASQTKFA